MSALVALPAMETTRRHKKMLRDGSGEVWPDHAEVLFARAIQEFDKQSSIASANSPYPPDLPSRNEFIVRYLKDRGLDRTKQQVASHIQQLKKRSSKELAGGAGSTPSSPSTTAFGMSYGSPVNQHHHQSDSSYYGQSSHSMYYAPPLVPAAGSYATNGSHPSPLSNATNGAGTGSNASPIQAIAIRVNDAQPLQVPTNTLVSTPPRYSSGPATLTGVSPSPSGSLAIRIRLIVPPHQPDALTHLASSRISAMVTLNPSYLNLVQTTTLGNKIQLNGMFLLEETDNFLVQNNQILCPLRISEQTRMMVGSQNNGLPVTIQQTVYGGSSAILKITYELVHTSQPPSTLSSANAMYQYPASAGPFTQF